MRPATTKSATGTRTTASTATVPPPPFAPTPRLAFDVCGFTGECYTLSDGSDYRGEVSTTEDGVTCQYWSRLWPHTHDKTVYNYPKAGLGGHNFCRNPDGEAKPWCYTTGEERRRN